MIPKSKLLTKTISCSQCQGPTKIGKFASAKGVRCAQCISQPGALDVRRPDQSSPSHPQPANVPVHNGPAAQLQRLQDILVRFGFSITKDRQRYRKQFGDANGNTITIDALINQNVPTFVEPGQTQPILISGFQVTTQAMVPSVMNRAAMAEVLPEECHEDVFALLDQAETGVKRDIPTVAAVKCEVCPPGQPPVDSWLIVGQKIVCTKCAKLD